MTLASSKALASKITYPPPPRKGPLPPPLSTPQSRELVQQYRRAAASRKNDMRRFLVAADAQAGPTALELTEEGKRFLEAGETDLALASFLESIRMGTDTAEVYQLVAEAYQQKDMLEDAIDYYTRSLSRDPMNTRLYQSRGDCHLLLDNPDTAADEFEKYLQMENPGHELLVKTGKACLDAERLDRAEELFFAALRQKPNDPYVFYNLGELNEKRGDNTKAKEYYAKVMEADPAFADPYLQTAAESESRGNLEMALHLYESILKVKPSDPLLYMCCADVYLILGQEFAPNALTCLTQAVQLDTSTSSEISEAAYVKRGMLLFDNFSEVEGAIADFSMCLGINPQHEQALEYRAACFRQRNRAGDLAAAKADYETLVSLPHVPESVKGAPHVFLGEFYFAQRDYTRAASHYSSAWQCGFSYRFDRQKLALSFMHSAMERQRNASIADVGSMPSVPSLPPQPTAAAAAAAVAPHYSEPPPATPPEVTRGVLPLLHILLDSYYRSRKDLEPTAHDELFYLFADVWGPYRDRVEKRREEESNPKGKKPAKKK